MRAVGRARRGVELMSACVQARTLLHCDNAKLAPRRVPVTPMLGRLARGFFWPRRRGGKIRMLIATGLLVVLALLTWNQGHIYRDVETLWRDTLAKNPTAWMAHTSRRMDAT